MATSPHPWLPAPHPHGWALPHILLCSQLHTKGLCARPSARSHPLPPGTQKPCLCHGRLRRRLGGLPGWPGETSLAPSLLPQSWRGPQAKGGVGGPQRHPLSTGLCRPPAAGEASHSRDPSSSPPHVPLCLHCRSGGGKKGEKNKKSTSSF